MSDSSNSSAAPPPPPGHLAAAPRAGANIRYACFAAADLVLPAMPIDRCSALLADLALL
uniref:Uncharacterized protein n=1 Tax=Arundo donax TaxID=35708 RepID=A0A0A8ZXD3_ARUDO